MNPHPDDETLGLLVEGLLHSDRSEALLLHLSDCAECLERAEARWEGIPGLFDDADLPSVGGDWTRIEGGLLRQVHLAALGTQVTWLVTEGFLSVVLVLLRPVVSRRLADSGGGSE